VSIHLQNKLLARLNLNAGVELMTKVYGQFYSSLLPSPNSQRVCRLFQDQVCVSSQKIVFISLRKRYDRILDAVDLETPAWERETTGMWIDVPRATVDWMHVNSIDVAEAIHGAQHAFINRFSLARDIKTECKEPEKERELTQINFKRTRPAR
jgi:DEAD/DEAH box helicase domain-containing protein